MNEILPVLCFLLHVFCVDVEGNHLESLLELACLLVLLSGANVGTVAATQTVENRGLDAEMHALESCGSLNLLCLETLDASQLVVGKNERTDGSVRTNERTLVTLDTVLYVPYRNECLNTTLLESCCAVLPCTVDGVVLNEVGNLQEVTCLAVDRTDELLNESGSVVFLSLLVGEVCPCGINGELLVLVAAVNGSEVFVDNVLTLL